MAEKCVIVKSRHLWNSQFQVFEEALAILTKAMQVEDYELLVYYDGMLRHTVNRSTVKFADIRKSCYSEGSVCEKDKNIILIGKKIEQKEDQDNAT